MRSALRGCIGLALAMLLAACTARSASTASPSTSLAGPASVAASTLAGTSASVEAPPPVAEGDCPWSASRWGPGAFEIRGAASGGTLWALVFGRQPLARKVEVKIVWSITGAGGLSLIAVSPSGAAEKPTHEPSAVGGNWHRPGAEYGSAFVFREPGCWRIHAERGAVAGDIWLRVA